MPEELPPTGDPTGAPDAGAEAAPSGERPDRLDLPPLPPTPPRGRRARWVALGLLAIMLVTVMVAPLWRRHRRAQPAAAPEEPAGEGTPITALPPLQLTPDPAAGLETAPFEGFAVSVETVPSGALVTVAGQARGEAPALAGVSCEPGQPVEVRATLKGRRPAVRQLTCRADTLVKLRLELAR
ncbi:MAG: hypothetical protein QM767_27900 [Anaeromyxobacter sp.]